MRAEDSQLLPEHPNMLPHSTCQKRGHVLCVWLPALVLCSLDWTNVRGDSADVKVSGDSSDSNKLSSAAQIWGEGWSGRHGFTLTSDLFSSSVIMLGGGGVR